MRGEWSREALLQLREIADQLDRMGADDEERAEAGYEPSEGVKKYRKDAQELRRIAERLEQVP